MKIWCVPVITSKWITTPLPLVVLLKRVNYYYYCEFLEALNIGLVW